MRVHVTHHAYQRWQERIGYASRQQIKNITRSKMRGNGLRLEPTGAYSYSKSGRKVIVRMERRGLVVVTVLGLWVKERSEQVIRLEIPGIPPSWNQIMRMHHMEQHKHARLWQDEILLMSLRFGRKYKLPIKKARVTLRYRFPDRRRRDPDNYSGKFILDGLRLAGIIEDDSFDNIQLVIERGEPIKGGAVEIEIQEVA